MITYKIENNQANADWSQRSINLPDWLVSGDYAEFQTDEDIDQDKAFKAVTGYAMQHLPVAFRSKDIKQASGYEWLDGKMQGRTAVSVEECKRYLVEDRKLSASGINAMTDAKIKTMYRTLRDVEELGGSDES